MGTRTTVLTALLLSTVLSLPPLASHAQAQLSPGDIVVLEQSGGTNFRGSLVRIHPTTGTRTILSDFGDASQGPVVLGPKSIALGAGGQILVIDLGTFLLRVDAATGHRALLGRFTNHNINPSALAIDAAGGIWVASLFGSRTAGRGALFRFDTATGRETRVSDLSDATQGPVELNARGMAIEPSGHILLTAWGAGTTTHLVRVDPATGARTVLSDFRNAAQGPPGRGPIGIAVLPAGHAILVGDPYAGTNGRGVLFSIDAVTGVRTVQQDFAPLGQHPQWMAVNAAGEVLVSDQTADLTSGDIVVVDGGGLIPGTGLLAPGVLFRVDPVTGERHIFSNFAHPGQGPLGKHPAAAAFDSAGNLLVVATSVEHDPAGVLFHVHPATGVRTVVSDFSDSTQGPRGVALADVTTDVTGTILVLAADGGANHRGLLFRVHPVTGERRIISNFNRRSQGPLGVNPAALAVDTAGNILVVDKDAGAGERGILFSVDPSLGFRRVVTNFNSPVRGPLGVNPNDLLLDPGGNIFVIDPAGEAGGAQHHGRLFSVHPGNRTRRLLSDFTDPTQGLLGLLPISVTVDPFRRVPRHVLVVDAGGSIGLEPNITFVRGRLLRVNTATGRRTLLSNFGNRAQGPLGNDPLNAVVVP